MGHPLTLEFNSFELIALSAAAVIAAFVSLDGESNWLEGAMLLAVYLILALAFFSCRAGLIQPRRLTMLFDLSYEQLKTYLPSREEPPDFDVFGKRHWQDAQLPLDAHFEPIDFHLCTLETFDVTFNGYGGQPVKGWLLLPRQRSRPLPCVVDTLAMAEGEAFLLIGWCGVALVTLTW